MILKKIGVVLFSSLALIVLLSVIDFGFTSMVTQTYPFMNRECTDSDRGFDFYFKGTTGYPLSYMQEDKCLRSNYLEEYFCFRNRVHKKRVLCPKGYICNDGECITTSEYNMYNSRNFMNFHVQWINQTNRTQPFIYDKWEGADDPRQGIFAKRFDYGYWLVHNPKWYG